MKRKHVQEQSTRKHQLPLHEDERPSKTLSIRQMELNDLPNETLIFIISFLDGAEILLSINNICRRFRTFLSSVKLWTSITTFKFCFFPAISDRELIASAALCPLLPLQPSSSIIKLVDFRNCKKIGFSLIQILPQFSSIQHLVLDGTIIIPETIQAVFPLCPFLREFRASNIGRPPLSDELYVELMLQSPNLQILDVEGWGLSSRINVGCARFPSSFIIALDLSFNNLTDWGISIACAKVLSSSLLYLDVSNSLDITDEGLGYIANTCSRLVYLNLRNCGAIHNLSVQTLLTRCLFLQFLDISATGVNHKLFDFFSRFRHESLKELFLNNSGDMEKSNGLSLVGFCFPSLIGLDISDCIEITDSVIDDMAQNIRNLQWINLGSLLKLTNRSLFSLASMNPNLRRVYIGGCFYVTESSLGSLLRRYPALKLFRHDNRQDCQKKRE